MCVCLVFAFYVVCVDLPGIDNIESIAKAVNEMQKDFEKSTRSTEDDNGSDCDDID